MLWRILPYLMKRTQQAVLLLPDLIKNQILQQIFFVKILLFIF